ncbi:25083_t:CDS:2 [Gigaspora rosea]|nr:25083_t:CDS:2 [Gigaspora rosea]
MSYPFNTSSHTINSDDEWDSDSLSEDIQDPENPVTWDFSKQIDEELSDEIQEIETINIPQLIKLGKANAEIVTKIKYRLEFEEYPETLEDGVTCIYNITGMDIEKAKKIFDLKNIQYSYKDGIVYESIYCPFLQTKVYKETQNCNSIKMCQFAAPELVSMTHSSVDFNNNLFKKVFDSNELSLDTNTLK